MTRIVSVRTLTHRFLWPESPFVTQIRSLTNPRIKQIVRLQRDAADRRASGLFCLETPRDLARALAAGFQPVQLYLCTPILHQPDASVAQVQRMLDDGSVFDVPPPVLQKIAYRENPSGFVAVMQAKPTASGKTIFRDHGRPLVLVCSGLEKPGNIGAILRSADAAGVDAVMIDSPEFDLFNPNCIRASTGAVFSVPVICAPPQELIDTLRAHNITIIAATPEAPITYLGIKLNGSLALVVGSEDKGLSEIWRSAATLSISIPMQSRTVDSLNVAATASLLLFEAMRQRIG